MLSEYWLAGTTRSYWVMSSLLMAVYVVAMLAGTHYADTFPSPLRALAALFPLLPVVGFVWLEFRRIRATDECVSAWKWRRNATVAIGTLSLLAWACSTRPACGYRTVVRHAGLMGIYVVAQVWAHRRYQ